MADEMAAMAAEVLAAATAQGVVIRRGAMASGSVDEPPATGPPGDGGAEEELGQWERKQPPPGEADEAEGRRGC